MSDPLAYALDAASYTDRSYFEREQEHVFRRCWQYAGHVSRLEAPGDYFAFDLHGRSLFCLKDRDGEIRTFYNVCAHRGNCLVHNDRGSVAQFTCSFHSWRYGLDGEVGLRLVVDDHRDGSGR